MNPYLIGKCKVFPTYALKAYRGIRGIAPTILCLGTDGAAWAVSGLHPLNRRCLPDHRAGQCRREGRKPVQITGTGRSGRGPGALYSFVDCTN
jgi:hypothetical protein